MIVKSSVYIRVSKIDKNLILTLGVDSIQVCMFNTYL